MSLPKKKILLPHPAMPDVPVKEGRINRPKPASKTRVGKPKEPSVDPARVRAIFERFAALNPNPQGELDYVNSFTLLVAVVLSAQATDVGVNKATKKLFAHADNPRAMLERGEEGVREDIRTIGLFRAKAKNVVALSAKLLADYGGQVPRTREELETLPGVGRKTANVVLNIAFGQPTIAVDTHLFRVSNRIPLARGETPLAVEQGLLRIIPPEFLMHAHHWLILHGRYICKARKPLCEVCPIAEFCQYLGKTSS
jgi:endonuclease-3